MVKADKPVFSGKQYHVACGPKDVGKYVLMPGDPARVPKIASFLDGAKQAAYHREYNTYTGAIGKTKVSVTSSGLGPSPMSVPIEELARIAPHTFLRVGTSGSLHRDIRIGDLVISSAAVLLEGASKDYVRPEYPASASHEVLMALIWACEKLGVRYHVGITASTNTFFCGQGRPGFSGYEQSCMRDLIPDLKKARVLNFEMEAATLFTLCSLFGLRAGTICGILANRETNEFADRKELPKIEEKVVRVSVEAVRMLLRMDSEKQKAGKNHWHPGLFK